MIQNIVEIILILAIPLLIYVFVFHQPDHTQDKKRETTNDDVVTPGNPSMIKNLDDLKEYTREELRQYDGKDGKPIYIAIANKVFDCSAGVNFYGAGGPYEMFAGRDISRAAAKFSKCAEHLDNHSIKDLSPAETESYLHYYNTLYGKYPMIGKIVNAKSEEKKNTEQTDTTQTKKDQ